MNKLLDFAYEIRKAAEDLEPETKNENVKEEPILIDEKAKRRVNKEIQAYSTFLRKFLSVKGNDKVLGKLKPLFDNPRIRKPRNSILLTLEKGEDAAPISNVAELITDLRRILLRYGSLVDRYPAVRLIKEILNFGVVNGIAAFKRLLSTERRLYNTFGAQGSLEREKEKDEKVNEQKGN
jgi:hypothetical protein